MQAANDNGKPRKIDYFDIGIIFCLLVAMAADSIQLLASAFILFPPAMLLLGLPGILLHYCAAIFVAFAMFRKIHHFVPKLILFIGIVLPVPFFTILIILAIVTQNRAIEFLVTEAGIMAIAAIPVADVTAPVLQAAQNTKITTQRAQVAREGVEGIRTLGETAKFKQGVRAFEGVRDEYDAAEDPDGDRAYRLSKVAEDEELAGIPNIEQQTYNENFPSMDALGQQQGAKTNNNELYAANDNQKNGTIKTNGNTVDLRGHKKAS